jgi:hypothetical protein
MFMELSLLQPLAVQTWHQEQNSSTTSCLFLLSPLGDVDSQFSFDVDPMFLLQNCFALKVLLPHISPSPSSNFPFTNFIPTYF